MPSPSKSELRESDLLNAPPVTALGSAQPKLVHLQILRAIAASFVVIDHAVVLLHNAGFNCAQYNHPGYLIGHTGVAAFFVLSGLIMVRQSAGLFGTPRGPFLFAYRRITRIVPMYWIATLLWAATLWRNEDPHPKRQILYSLLFIPNYFAGHTRLFPVLPLGWTLNYEMFFYLLFFFALFLPRKRGIVLLLLLLGILVAIGQLHTFPDTATPLSILNVYTNPFLLLFAFGVLIGDANLEIKSLKVSVPVSPAFLLALPALLFLVFPLTLGAYPFYELLSIYSILVVLLCLLNKQERPGSIGRTLVLLGDASYSTYLFHPVIVPAILTIALKLWGSHDKTASAAMLLVMICILVANLVGLLVHLAIERPLIRVFRSIV